MNFMENEMEDPSHQFQECWYSARNGHFMKRRLKIDLDKLCGYNVF